MRATAASSTVLPRHTASLPEIGTSNASHLFKIFDFRTVALHGTEDEVDIDDYIGALDGEARASVADAGAWVADTFYAGRQTLATLRLRARMTQRQLAEKCGVEQPHISRYESGNVEPKLSHACKLADALGVSLDEFARAFRNTGQ